MSSLTAFESCLTAVVSRMRTCMLTISASKLFPGYMSLPATRVLATKISRHAAHSSADPPAFPKYTIQPHGQHLLNHCKDIDYSDRTGSLQVLNLPNRRLRTIAVAPAQDWQYLPMITVWEDQVYAVFADKVQRLTVR